MCKISISPRFNFKTENGGDLVSFDAENRSARLITRRGRITNNSSRVPDAVRISNSGPPSLNPSATNSRNSSESGARSRSPSPQPTIGSSRNSYEVETGSRSSLQDSPTTDSRESTDHQRGRLTQRSRAAPALTAAASRSPSPMVDDHSVRSPASVLEVPIIPSLTSTPTPSPAPSQRPSPAGSEASYHEFDNRLDVHTLHNQGRQQRTPLAVLLQIRNQLSEEDFIKLAQMVVDDRVTPNPLPFLNGIYQQFGQSDFKIFTKLVTGRMDVYVIGVLDWVYNQVGEEDYVALADFVTRHGGSVDPLSLLIEVYNEVEDSEFIDLVGRVIDT